MIHKTVNYVIFALALAGMAGCAHQNLSTERDAAYRTYQDGDYARAAEAFEKLVGTIPKDPELWFRLGNAHARAKAPEKAIDAYENALLRDPEMAKAWYNMGLIYTQAALKTFVDMSVYIDPDDPVGRQGRLMLESLFALLEGSAPEEDNDR